MEVPLALLLALLTTLPLALLLALLTTLLLALLTTLLLALLTTLLVLQTTLLLALLPTLLTLLGERSCLAPGPKEDRSIRRDALMELAAEPEGPKELRVEQPLKELL